MVVGIVIKFQEYSLLEYSLVRNSSSLLPKTSVRQVKNHAKDSDHQLISCTHWTRSQVKWQAMQKINLINLAKQLVLSAKHRFSNLTLRRTISVHSLAYIYQTKAILKTYGIFAGSYLYYPTAKVVQNEVFLSLRGFTR